MRNRKAALVGAPVKSIALDAVVTLGPESAARLGVPVGTKVDYGTIAFWHRSPLVRAWRRFRHGISGRVAVTG